MLPSGIICLWYGSILSIPGGWLLCDGSNGTPDLRDRFIIGAGGAYAVDGVGGAQQHNHTFTSDGHYHTLEEGEGLQSGTDINNFTSTDPDSGTTDNNFHLPPYHALAYIMKT